MTDAKKVVDSLKLADFADFQEAEDGVRTVSRSIKLLKFEEIGYTLVKSEQELISLVEVLRAEREIAVDTE